ncbi:MAG TPA: hypothetical protein VE978_03220 [Chitinophagales bacterium]|nr:hypothetical protein [Chitinophagales bacterium]
MKKENFWVRLSIINLCTVAIVGIILRSKIIFSLPFINYNYLLEAHEHFAFGAWATLGLMFLLVYELLPESLYRKPVYQWLLAGIALNSWIMLFTFSSGGNSKVSNIFSTIFIFFTYAFGWKLISDLRNSGVNKTVFLLTVSSVICLVISSVGPFTLAYLFAEKSLNVILYKDALYTYLHFQYNGFFTLAVFALLFRKLESKISDEAKKNIHRFSVLLVISILPSQFLTFLWEGSNNNLFLFMAIAGSIFLLLSLLWFIISALSISKVFKTVSPVVKYLGIISMSAFALKIFLQSFTIFPTVGNAVFGDRPVIIGFLHLVFLAFVSIFLLAYFSHREFLNIKNKFTRVALVVFTLGVIFNEAVLMSQGLGAMFIKGSQLFPWLLWIASIWLFYGALLITIACFKYNATAKRELMEGVF